MKTLTLLLLLSLSANAFDAKEIQGINDVKFVRAYDTLKKHCLKTIEMKIKTAASRDDSYVHILPIACWGNMLGEISADLQKKGFQTKIDSVGIEGVHFEQMITVAW